MPQGAVPFRLEDVQGSNPVLLLFAPSDRSPAYENQISLLAEDQVLEYADIVLVKVLKEGTSTARGERIDEASVEMIANAYDLDEDGFLLVLLGADGTEKYRSDAPVPASIVLERLSDASQRKPT